MSDFTFEYCLPARNEAVIDPDIGSEQRALGAVAKVFDRAELDFHFAGLRHGRIRAVEGTICLGGLVPAGKHSGHRERSGCRLSIHGTGRNTQIAAGSPDCARTATNSRSSSGTNKD